MLLFGKPTRTASKLLWGSLIEVRSRFSLLLFTILVVCSGCADSQSSAVAPPAAAATPGAATAPAEAKADPLADVLRLAGAGDTDAAVDRFVTNPPTNWVESTSLPDLQISEAEFAKLSRAEKAALQQQCIDRVAQIKTFARTVVERANDAQKSGDAETAQRYVDAVNRLGSELRDSDTLLVFQQMGKALAEVKLSE
jgi:hypothetical protein